MEPLSRCIIDIAQQSEYGDRFQIRLQILLSHIAYNAIVNGNKNCISEEYKTYRCFTLFNFHSEYSSGEYDRWMDSLEDLAVNNLGKGLFLVVKFSEKKLKKIIQEVIPDLKYTISNDTLIINLDNIASNLQ